MEVISWQPLYILVFWQHCFQINSKPFFNNNKKKCHIFVFKLIDWLCLKFYVIYGLFNVSSKTIKVHLMIHQRILNLDHYKFYIKLIISYRLLNNI
jgi:hypothetical protein